MCKQLKKENVHIALDTAGVGIGKYELLLPYIDLIIFDIKHTTRQGFIDLTGTASDEYFRFLEVANILNKKFWVRQVIIPGITDSKDYLIDLKNFIAQNIQNVEKVEFLPFHYLGKEKYQKMHIDYPLKDIPEMDKILCNELFEEFRKLSQK